MWIRENSCLGKVECLLKEDKDSKLEITAINSKIEEDNLEIRERSLTIGGSTNKTSGSVCSLRMTDLRTSNFR